MASNGARDKNGRFTAGHPGGPGRPRKDKELEAEYYRILQTAVSADDFAAIIAKLVTKAKYGDIQSAKLLIEYLVGSPEQYLNVVAQTVILGLDEMLDKSYGTEDGSTSAAG